MKHNPFQMTTEAVDPKLKEMLRSKLGQYYGKGSEWTDDLWATYQDLLAQMPERAGALYQAWLAVSEEMHGDKPFAILGLSEYEDVFWHEEDGKWYGVKDDTREKLPESVQDYEEIWWDGGYHAFVGTKQVAARANPASKLIVYDAGRNEWFNILTGEVER